ncbi:MAG: transposase [Cyanobacteria bacterium P01_B01_bin.77]
MGLNLSNQQIAKELNLNKDDVQKMTHGLRQAVVDKASVITLSEDVEFDEVYITAGHKGHPEAVKKRTARGDDANSKGYSSRSKLRGRGTLETQKPLVFGLIQRDSDLVIRPLQNVQQITIEPIIKATVIPGSLIYTGEYGIYNSLEE